jgi:phosphoglycolate phosphatase
MAAEFKLSCVLFDLDGTLVDTAPDLLLCLNKALIQHGFESFSTTTVKPFISFGAVALVHETLKDHVSEDIKATVVETMLSIYENNIAEQSALFSGLADTLALIEVSGLKWGVVTNKRERFTQPLMAALNLTHRAACIISGDTTPNPKPHSDPMLEACKRAAVSPENCVYIGDAIHDIKAGYNANMKTLVALYGYLRDDDKPETWGADALIASPQQLTEWIESSLCL